MERYQKVLITVGVAIIITIGLYLISGVITRYTGYAVSEQVIDDFAACLEQQDITLYINTETPEEILKKNEIINYLPYVKIMNCKRDKETCDEIGIIGFPTWLINNQIITGELTLQDLSEFSGCRL